MENLGRAINVGGDAVHPLMTDIDGNTDLEFQRRASIVCRNLLEVTNDLIQKGGDDCRRACYSIDLIEEGKCYVFIAEDCDHITKLVRPVLFYPDDNSVISGIIVNVSSEELIRDWKTWDQETFRVVSTGVTSLGVVYDSLNTLSSKQQINVEKFNQLFRQNPQALRMDPLKIRQE